MIRDLVLKNRSYRGYDRSFRLTREEILSFVDNARLSPSSMNRQPLKFFVAEDEETVAKIQALTKWAAALKDRHLPEPGTEPVAFVVICLDQTVDANLTTFLRDVGIAAQTILLSAVEKGWGGCMIGNFPPLALRDELGLPETILPNLLVALGRPSETVVLTEPGADGSVAYRRGDDNIHYVPKRSLEEIIL